MRGLALLVWLPVVALAQGFDGGVTVVSAPRPRPPGSTSLRGTEAADQPLVEHDALKAVQTLPGVGHSALGSADVVVWGAAPRETMVLIDGIEVPALFHLGGYRSVLSSSLVGRLVLEPAAFRAEVGRSLGGTVRVETVAPPAGFHGAVSVDPSDVSAALSLGGDTANLIAAARVSTLWAIIQPFLHGAAADRYPLPRSWDAQLRGSWQPSGRDELTVLGLASSDLATLEVTSDDPSLSRSRTDTRDSYRLGLSWRRGEEADAFTATAFLGHDRQMTRLATPLASAQLAERTWNGGILGRSRSTLGPGVSLSFGFDGRVASSVLDRSGPLTRPPREGDITAFGAPLSDLVAVDDWSVLTIDAALFAEAELTIGPVTVTPGLRLSAVGGEASRLTPKVAATPAIGSSQLDFALEPRGMVSWALARWLTLNAAGGMTHQAPDAADRSAVFGSPLLHPARGAHAAVGFAVQAVSVLTLEATGFVRAVSGLAVRDPTAQAPLAQVLVATGEGRASGAQLVLRQRAWRGLTSWLSYTLSRSERRSGTSEAWHLADSDQTHVLTASVSQRVEAWRFGVRARWATGTPRTPVVGGSFDTRRGLYEPLFGTQNSTRLSDFLQLDAEGSYTFIVAALHLELFVELMNLTNHHNVEEWVYDTTFSRRSELWGLPFFGLLGLRGGF